MKIAKFRVLNYKSIRDSGDVPLMPSFNIIVGKNDAGKSALVKALSLQFSTNAHRSKATAPSPTTTLTSPSRTTITLTVSRMDVLDILSQQSHIYLPIVDNNNNPTEVARIFERFLHGGESITLEYVPGQNIYAWSSTFGETTSQEYFQYKNTAAPSGIALAEPNRIAGGIEHFARVVAETFRRRVYAFDAERVGVGQCTVQGATQLTPSAANLPDVLNQLISANPSRFARYMTLVRVIFPHISQITVPNIGNNTAKILVWTTPPDDERADLAFPLAESGTGIGQVLAILYVLSMADTPQTIIIDEPQSFLHPGAIRKLLEILREHSMHQYIITTHAPSAFSGDDADGVLLVTRRGQESQIESINPSSQNHLRILLAEVGARLSDVFGADAIFWVEGKTEETCFPLLIRKISKSRLEGVQILGLLNTGDIEGKHASKVIQIYQRLTGAEALLPSAVGFVLDREGRSAKEMEDVGRASKGLVKWLPKRMYENYLLSPPAICLVLNRNDFDKTADVTEEVILDWLKNRGSGPKYFVCQRSIPSVGTSEWVDGVDGANILLDLFNDLTDARVRYDKVKHGMELTKEMIEKPTKDLIALSDFLAQTVKHAVEALDL